MDFRCCSSTSSSSIQFEVFCFFLRSLSCFVQRELLGVIFAMTRDLTKIENCAGFSKIDLERLLVLIHTIMRTGARRVFCHSLYIVFKCCPFL